MEGSSVVPLACWLRDYAGGIGRTAVALKAARVAFGYSLSLENFRAVETWAGTDWDAIRKGLLEQLASAPHAYDRIRIYLSEGLIGEAVRAVGDRFEHGAHDETLMHLARAAHASHPEWVIRLAMHQANSIMDANRAGHYALAAQWLEKGRVRPRGPGSRGRLAGLPRRTDRAAPPQVQATTVAGEFAREIGKRNSYVLRLQSNY